MDVRYNVINWVHRSTRGWSYGSSVVDPRTGEIIKGHVLLGSLRVRQDFLIAQGLVDAYPDGSTPDPRLQELALARLRQLSAHEVGHTIGLAHNFAASTNDRASVMDYPHPLILLDENGKLDLSQAYDQKIGAWDKRTVLYGYQDFAPGTDERTALLDILHENDRQGLRYISDADARPISGAQPYAHLWDNGKNPADELQRLLRYRQQALQQLGLQNIPPHAPVATLENVLVPLYLAHRYQVEATAKLLGGVQYTYATRDNRNEQVLPVSADQQTQALDALLSTLSPEHLRVPNHLSDFIPPQPPGYQRDRELFSVRTGMTFDPLAAAESAASHTIRYLLDGPRLTRLQQQHYQNAELLNAQTVIERLWENSQMGNRINRTDAAIKRIVQKLIIRRLVELAANPKADPEVVGLIYWNLSRIEQQLAKVNYVYPANRAHDYYLTQVLQQFKTDPQHFQSFDVEPMPDGSPIGCH